MTSSREFAFGPALSLAVWEDACLGPGGVVWDAAVVLAQALVDAVTTCALRRDVCAIELGAGVGLPGLTLAALGATVTLTDKPALMPLLERNVEANGLAAPSPERPGLACARPFLFGGSPKKLGKRVSYDVILCSDILGCGDASAYPGLVKTLTQLCGPDTSVYMSYRRRAAFEEDFFELVRPLFSLTRLCVITKDDTRVPFRDVCDEPVTVFLLRRRSEDGEDCDDEVEHTGAAADVVSHCGETPQVDDANAPSDAKRLRRSAAEDRDSK